MPKWTTLPKPPPMGTVHTSREEEAAQFAVRIGEVVRPAAGKVIVKERLEGHEVHVFVTPSGKRPDVAHERARDDALAHVEANERRPDTLSFLASRFNQVLWAPAFFVL